MSKREVRMLPESERRALREIEEELRSSDPAFAEVLGRRPWVQAWSRKLLFWLSSVTAVLMLAVGILANRADLALWGILGTGALLRFHFGQVRKHRREPETPQTDNPRPAAWMGPFGPSHAPPPAGTPATR